MATITGFIEKIKYRNEDNGYTVLSVTDQSDGEEVIMVGNLAYVAEGDMIEASGHMTEHPVYGEQLQIEHYDMKLPQDELSVERYLGSGAIKGIGAALAARIVRHFKADTLRVMEEEPERLSEVKGISEKMAMAIAEQFEEKKDMRQAMMFLQNYGISMNLAAKIYQEYGPRLYGIIRENPYRLADDIPGVGFKMADEIAERVGIFTDSDYRIKAGILYTLLQASANGHTYLPKSELFGQASELLKVEPSAMEKHLMDMQIERRIVVKAAAACPSDPLVFSSHYYYLELNTARMLHDLNIRGDIPETEIRANLLKIQKQEDIRLDTLQEQAVCEAASSGLLVITGGPGTGKTTTINAIIHYFEMEGMEILLAAPTGRAAKRMTEATGYEARTIHRMLELVPSGLGDVPGQPGAPGSSGMHFDRNEENPLDADVIIIDEMSMVDISLMHSLLRAVNVGTRLILVGDVDQLPSVGPGNVLRDIIASGCFNVVKLTRIFRQAAQSDIIVNAHKINEGEPVDLAKRSKDFLFIRRDTPDAVISAAITLIQQKLPGYVHASQGEIQVMTPMRKGALGVERLNQILQQYLNPPDKSKKEKEAGGITYRVGDKVMQVKNNYQMEWEVRNKYGIPTDKGSGIFNGDMGIIREINEYAELLTVEFDEGKMIEYTFKQLEELELAYAITIHKSQGSEYPAVIIPMYNGPRMLMTRNLIYTAVTRARSCVCLVGLPEAFRAMAANCLEQKRYSGLKNRIEEIYALSDPV
ncbi:SF1B family DNA helicase RecD2 [Lacrimispora sp. 210928-DFI.3.58]|uniref:SF1B family DNA helicase RecD2 n=1 Tax=Lacrimispora sp. 210928-DFI.3.58 TaxID=2883214 RepID=UPI0015B61137|nr:ATP-dependent RecD-like DNA helicase [Lacrimispora sp. 210928-DFI.3.58]MCB7319133.1 ATP-dependent RecD-like DNA helicase [Lacrimispora sp. 210928-DFI.3.58]